MKELMVYINSSVKKAINDKNYKAINDINYYMDNLILENDNHSNDLVITIFKQTMMESNNLDNNLCLMEHAVLSDNFFVANSIFGLLKKQLSNEHNYKATLDSYEYLLKKGKTRRDIMSIFAIDHKSKIYTLINSGSEKLVKF